MNECYKQLDRICQDIFEELPKFMKKHKAFYKKYDPYTTLVLKKLNSDYILHIDYDQVMLKNDYGSAVLTIEFGSNTYTEYAMPEYESISYGYKRQYEFILRENNGLNDDIDEDIMAHYDPETKILSSNYLDYKKEINSLDCCKELLFQMNLEYDNLIDAQEMWTIITSYRKLDTLGINFRFENNHDDLKRIPDLKNILVMP